MFPRRRVNWQVHEGCLRIHQILRGRAFAWQTAWHGTSRTDAEEIPPPRLRSSTMIIMLSMKMLMVLMMAFLLLMLMMLSRSGRGWT
jgi:hypothetical protein